MLKRTNRSGIINMSSVAGVTPCFLEPIYSATKAYIDTLSRMIEEDVRDKINVISVRPHVVSTPMTKNPKISGFVIGPQDHAKAVLGQIGRTAYTYGHWKHAVRVWIGKNATLDRCLLSGYLNSTKLGPDAVPWD